jgi:hypothetical protein
MCSSFVPVLGTANDVVSPARRYYADTELQVSQMGDFAHWAVVGELPMREGRFHKHLLGVPVGTPAQSRLPVVMQLPPAKVRGRARLAPVLCSFSGHFLTIAGYTTKTAMFHGLYAQRPSSTAATANTRIFAPLSSQVIKTAEVN